MSGKRVVVVCVNCGEWSDESPEVFVSFDGERGLCQPCVAVCVETIAKHHRRLSEAEQ